MISIFRLPRFRTNRHFSTNDAINFPYQFLNKAELVTANKNKKVQQSCAWFNQFANDPAKDLNKGNFRKIYINLLKSIAQNDTTAIASICEKTLYREFFEGL
jgi:hypothetical protein